MAEGLEVTGGVSDRDRDRVLDQLHARCREGQLNLDDFAERVSVALAASSQADLMAALDDLPVSTGSVRQQRGLRWSVAILGSNRKRARWRLSRRARAIAVVGTCWLDLRSALIESDEIQITATALFGTVKVVVPKGIGVELSGVTLGGAKTDKTSGGMLPDGPVVRVRGFPIFGSVRVIDADVASIALRKQLGQPHLDPG